MLYLMATTEVVWGEPSHFTIRRRSLMVRPFLGGKDGVDGGGVATCGAGLTEEVVVFFLASLATWPQEEGAGAAGVTGGGLGGATTFGVDPEAECWEGRGTAGVGGQGAVSTVVGRADSWRRASSVARHASRSVARRLTRESC